MRSELTIVSGVLMVLVIIMSLIFFGDDIGLPNAAEKLITVLPGLSLVVIGFFVVSQIKGVFLVGAFGFLGIGFALLIGEMYIANVIIPDIIESSSSLSLDQIQIGTMIGCFLIGSALAVMEDK